MLLTSPTDYDVGLVVIRNVIPDPVFANRLMEWLCEVVDTAVSERRNVRVSLLH
jgi:hypothetical protein